MDTIADIKVERARRAAYSKTFRALAAMTDKQLSDIGVARHAIDAIAQKAALISI